MFRGWSYAQVLRVIGQSLEERAVQDFSLVWEDGEFVLRGKRIAALDPRWVDKFFGQKRADVERNVEIHYNLKSVLWLQIRGDYFRLSQTLRTVGSYIESRDIPILSLARKGGMLYLELQERSGNKRIEEHAMGSFENYFMRTYLRWHKESSSSIGKEI